MKKIKHEKQQQNRPGIEENMKPIPKTDPIIYAKEGKLKGKVALITGGDSGIGKAVALLFAKEGADLAVAYLNEEIDAKATKKEVEKYNRKCLLIKGDLSKEENCLAAVEKTIEYYKQIDILVNNAALHWESESLENISSEQLIKTFQNNVFSYFWTTKFALVYMKKGGSIINTTSVTAYRGSPKLIDYAATKGAVVSFTRSLSSNLIASGIRVNAVAPGPVWTPLIVSSFDSEKVANFGTDSPMKRAGMPNEVAPSFLFLACEDSQFISGQVLHPNGGEIING
ncbi:SDR family oxidoreductase [Empedobacter stercoris]|uniref:SDR family oxidoreductase n=2 Tax=Empedobacter TaxID=59734 RepID=A0ABY8VCX7_9FLAO|nr:MULTISPECIES: SDR family oxidoreductase [Empedobacter]MCA4809792.1 SDR family oxidoreductase [Empedobacter stercoris]MDM1523583.1 SDR family oxidoreductase [Empedobacter sp. 225-1]UWX67180.1 SDR family oxidoreductase [Empedobacter stercoris]WIH97360.1 SDR family oxidoreductase [Empedobacter falsenii]HJD86518.1 SDR family oxidoreductase [Empedobacter falsenii]